MQVYILRQLNPEYVKGEDGAVIASFVHKSDAIRLSESLKLAYPGLDFPWSIVEVWPELWYNLYYALGDAVPLDKGSN